jgi:hypothetical protein
MDLFIPMHSVHKRNIHLHVEWLLSIGEQTGCLFTVPQIHEVHGR